MARAQFEYDEQGSTFYYVCVSFYAVILIPLTFYWWPFSRKPKDKATKKQCNCNPCIIKESKKAETQPLRKYRSLVMQILIFAGWVGFILLAWKAFSVKTEHIEYDPYAILEIDSGATAGEIRKQYRKLSMLHHPDRGGDTQKFVSIAKAYETLTDDEVRANWEKYGNPDGPGAMRFGIALPSWIVDKAYSYWVLGAYFLVFMVLLPVIVGIWWYRSMKYSADQVLLDTTQLYIHFLYKSPQMITKRIIMVLGASFEFNPDTNKKMIIRPSDEADVKSLMKELQSVGGENNKERFICFPYSVKARTLIHAHLSRLPIESEPLEADRQYIIKKMPLLIQEMISSIPMLISWANAGRIPRSPTLETLENAMKLCAMIVQAVLEKQSPLLQLPHFTDDILRHCIKKKRSVRCCADLAKMNHDDRLSLLRSLDVAQYHNIMNVLSSMPHVAMDVRVEVQDDEDKTTITAGALITVFVTLKRQSLAELPDSTIERSNEHGGGGNNIMASSSVANDNASPDAENGNGDEDESALASEEAKSSSHKPWERNKKKKGQAAKSHNKKKPTVTNKVIVVKKAVPPVVAAVSASNESSPSQKKDKAARGGTDNEGEYSDSDDESKCGDARQADEASIANNSDVDDSAAEDSAPAANQADDEDLMFDEGMSKKDKLLEAKSRITHSVHAPYFPDEKYEWWWLFVCDRKRKVLITAPQQVTSLVNEEQVELKFQAPSKVGPYAYQVCLRSDSYLDCDQNKDIKIDVHPAREITSHPQWDFQEEDEQEKEPSDAEEYTEEESDEDVED